jgi:protein-S-isoprenylcysteine O-methyltransferase Ste14
MLFFPLTSVALGSWWAVVPALLAVPLFLRRLFIEEHMLFAELEGYREYAERVPWRLIPGLW